MNATHPGAVATDQPRQAEEAYGVLGKVGVALATPFMVDPVDQGCRPALFAAAGEAVAAERIQGQYVSFRTPVPSFIFQTSWRLFFFFFFSQAKADTVQGIVVTDTLFSQSLADCPRSQSLRAVRSGQG